MIPEAAATIAVGTDVVLEAAVAVPAGASTGVVVCHPHPLYGGDMDSPVVTAIASACRDAGLASLRFNFRGVGASGGAHDGGRGEQEDVRASLAALAARLVSPSRLALAGYSFGAAMALAVAAAGTPALAGLALVAPPLGASGLPDTGALPSRPGAVLVVAGSRDDYCPAPALERLRRSLPAARVEVLDGADHFFWSHLRAVGALVRGWAAAL